jgi:hypothetical protein
MGQALIYLDPDTMVLHENFIRRFNAEGVKIVGKEFAWK